MRSAERVVDEHPELAYVAIYDAARKAMAAMRQAQGLRATTAGGHLAVQHAVKAQFGASMGSLQDPSTESGPPATVEYPDRETWIDTDAVHADLPAAERLVDAAEKAIEHLTVFVP